MTYPTIPKEIHAPHVPVPQGGCARIQWLAPQGGRVLAWTCACKAVVYELRQAGGLGYVRRIVQHDDRQHEVSETHHMPMADAHVLWGQILRGEAR